MECSKRIIQCDHPGCTTKFLEYTTDQTWGGRHSGRDMDPDFCFKQGWQCKMCNKDLCSAHCYSMSTYIRQADPNEETETFNYFGPVCKDCQVQLYNSAMALKESFKQQILLCAQPPEEPKPKQIELEEDILDVIRR